MKNSIFTKKQESEVNNYAYSCYSTYYKQAFGRKPNRTRFMKAAQEDKVMDLYKEISEKIKIDLTFLD